jgi:putative transposase
VQGDEHLLGLLRYVERNPLSAGLVDRAQLWRWGSLWARTRGTKAIKALLSPWPVQRPANWTARVNAPLTKKELDRVRVSIERGRPYGEEKWVRETVKDLGWSRPFVRKAGRAKQAHRRPRQQVKYAGSVQRSVS